MNISINQISSKLVKNLLNNADKLNLEVKEGALNCTIIDAGINTSGSIEAGLLISEICLGGLGKVTITPSSFFDDSTMMQISVHSSHPVIACLGSQYAGWSLSSDGFFSLGSGPVRSIAQKEEIFNILKYTDAYEKTVTILEVDKEPPKEIRQALDEDTYIENKSLDKLTIVSNSKKKFTKVNSDNVTSIISQLEKEMYNHAKNLEFEQAAQLRDQINGLQEKYLMLPKAKS